MPVYFHTEDVDFVFKNSLRLKRWIKAVLSPHKKYAGNINFIFCSDNYLLALNKSHLNHDYYTDVITFDLSASPELLAGDIFISIDRVRENAGNGSFENELHRVMIHGVLHLLGFSDKTTLTKKRMRAMEDDCLTLLASLR